MTTDQKIAHNVRIGWHEPHYVDVTVMAGAEASAETIIAAAMEIAASQPDIYENAESHEEPGPQYVEWIESPKGAIDVPGIWWESIVGLTPTQQVVALEADGFARLVRLMWTMMNDERFTHTKDDEEWAEKFVASMHERFGQARS